MHSYRLSWTAAFTRAFRRFMRRHPNLDNQVADVLKRLQTNPFEPSLRLHSLSGNLSGKQDVSITYAYRIVLCVEIVDKEIILYNIGTHDEVYG